MTPIVGKTSYKDLTPEELERFRREAEIMRAEAITSMFRTVFGAIGHAVAALFRLAERTVTGPTSHHKAHGAR